MQSPMPRKKEQPVDDWMPKCSSCAFFVPDPKEDIGECRRLPPVVFPDGDEGLGFSFSMSMPSHWCGEFKRKCDS